jgi:hypothetical protein
VLPVTTTFYVVILYQLLIQMGRTRHHNISPILDSCEWLAFSRGKSGSVKSWSVSYNDTSSGISPWKISKKDRPPRVAKRAVKRQPTTPSLYHHPPRHPCRRRDTTSQYSITHNGKSFVGSPQTLFLQLTGAFCVCPVPPSFRSP